jgi:hypothetical protein
MVEIDLNLVRPNSYHFMEFTSFFPLPRRGEEIWLHRYNIVDIVEITMV